MIKQSRESFQAQVADYVRAGRLTAEQARGVLDGSLDANVEAGLLTAEQLRDIRNTRAAGRALAEAEAGDSANRASAGSSAS